MSVGRAGQLKRCSTKMSWEERGGRRYYYRKRRVGGKVTSEYVGGGMLAHYAFLLDDDEKQKHYADRCAEEKFKQEQRSIDQAIDDYHQAVKQVVASELQRLGYHQHKRQWRKARKVADETAVRAGVEIFREYN